MYLEQITPYIGAHSEMIPQVAEQGAIRRFAIATMETDPVYYDEDYAQTTPYGGIIAPPTFVRSFYYPPVLPVEGQILPIRGRIHGSQRFEFFKPVKAGDTVWCRTTLLSAWEKEGSSGHLLFVTFEQAALDGAGEPYALGYNTAVYKESLLNSTDPMRFTTWYPMIPNDQWLSGLAPMDLAWVQPGDPIGPVTLPAVSRTWIAQWAGASNDFNPIHLDADAARRLGMDDVIAHGMLSAAVATRIFAAWMGEKGRITGFDTKFSASVSVGDVLEFRGSVTGVNRAAGEVRAEYVISKQNGAVALKGSMTGSL